MQEFLTHNTVSCNLMSLTGYRTLVIFQALLESPKSNDEINQYLLNNQYIKEIFSSDTLRIYINSLRAIGCKITKANKTTNNKYILTSHPFMYDIPKSQLKALARIYKNIYDKIDINDILIIEDFVKKLLSYIDNEETKNILISGSILKNIKREILAELLQHCKKRNHIVFLYNSPRSGEKKIELIASKLSFNSGKLYLWGDNLTHEQESYFSLDRILKIISVKIGSKNEDIPKYKFIYELHNYKDSHTLDQDERIIKKENDKLTIEITSGNYFDVMQKILSLGANCKVIAPENFKNDFINKLKNMEKIYEDS